MRRLSVSALLSATAVIACGCSTATFNVKVTLPSRAEAMQERQRVVVGDISGPWADEFAGILAQAISNSRFHTLIDRSNQEVTAHELERSIETGAYVDASSVGVAGATVVISGSTERGEYKVDRERRVVKLCTRRNDEGRCIRHKRIEYFDQRETCQAAAAVRVTRVTDNVVLFEHGFDGRSSMSQTREGGWPSRNEAEICSKAFDRAAYEATTWLSPFSANVRLTFRKIKDSPSTGRAIEFIKASMFDRASTLFEAALTDSGLGEEDIGWVRYNIAVVNWAVGRYEECVDQASMALEVLGADGDIVEVRNSCVQYAK